MIDKVKVTKIVHNYSRLAEELCLTRSRQSLEKMWNELTDEEKANLLEYYVRPDKNSLFRHIRNYVENYLSS
jgi:hypothetical protein